MAIRHVVSALRRSDRALLRESLPRIKQRLRQRLARARQETDGRVSLYVSLASGASACAGAALYSWLHPEATVNVVGYGMAVPRTARSLLTWVWIAGDYKHSLSGYEYKSAAYKEAATKVHERASAKVLRLCQDNGGVYIKAGQFVAGLNTVPAEYRRALSVLQNDAPAQPFYVVETSLRRELGRGASSLFRDFEERAAAAASLAQVHRAHLLDGREVAVKVQYPGLEAAVAADLSTMGVLARAAKWAFPGAFDFEWLIPELKRSLDKELDFGWDARNAERMARNFSHRRGDVAIPGIVWERSSPRVLTMEWVNGAKVDDTARIEEMGLQPREVGALLLGVFAEMMFCHGFIRKVKILKAPKFDITRLMEVHGDYTAEETGSKLDRPAEETAEAPTEVVGA